jgi:hypothetical protein
VQYNGTGSFTYPVGNASYYRPVGLNLGGNGSGVTATYLNVLPYGNLVTPLQAVTYSECWDLTPLSTASGTVTLNWDGSKVSVGIPATASDLSPLQVAHYTGGQWISEGGAATGTWSAGSITSANTISTWSPFALGSTDKLAIPLPLRFLTIGASLQADGSRLVRWTVGEESRLKNYTVERSLDGRRFDSIGTVAANGSGSYTYVDVQAVKDGVVYYRVRGNDLDGQGKYSATVTVAQDGTEQAITVTPNPVVDQMKISFGSGMAGTYGMQLFTVNGRLVYRSEVSVAAGQAVTVGRPANLAPGMYLLQLSDGHNKVSTFKLMFK